ncbi:chymotrypsin-like protease CTRL-1 [Drosophila kikkawai]|uniref:Chymotrypsin-like protease CTRL-1 n=1 Tax=Drosophila kikkawai TaxID=30033 RepID=A0ABM4GCR0_DROKI
MKCLLVLLAVIDLLFWHKGSASFLDEDCALINSSDVDFGKSRRHPAKRGTTPWMAMLIIHHGFGCGGTLITKNFVLTAAHCIDGQDQLSVKLGVYHSSCATRSCRGVESYNVINAIIHIDYNPVDGTNDIGLLELHSEVRYNNHIRPICIVTDDAINIDNINVFTAFGWGKTETRQASEVLMAVRLFRRSSEECNFEFKHQVRENQICAGSAIGDTCEGDSGGPLAFYDGERYIQVGIVSYGTKMCNASAIYTDVSKYKDWIVTNTRKNRRGNINRY